MSQMEPCQTITVMEQPRNDGIGWITHVYGSGLPQMVMGGNDADSGNKKDDILLEMAPGLGKTIYELMDKYHIHFILRIPAIALSIMSFIFFVLQIVSGCVTNSTTIKLLEFFLGFVINLKQATFDCKEKPCCTCECPCLKCEDCGCQQNFCMDMIRCYFCTCLECRHCHFCYIRNCFYCEMKNPFIECIAIFYGLIYFIYQIIGRALAKHFREDMRKEFKNKTEVQVECDEMLDNWTRILYGLSIIVSIVIIFKFIIGVLIFVDKYRNRKAGNDKSEC